MWVHPVIETSKTLSPLRARAPDPDCARAGAAPALPAGAAWAAYQRRLLPAPTAHPNVPTLLGTAPAPPAGRRQGRLLAPPPLRRIDGLKKPTEKADTVEKKTPGERTKAGKRLLHQRRLRGLGGGGGRPPPHLQTRSTLFRPARSRPPFSSPSLPRQASPLHQAKR